MSLLSRALKAYKRDGLLPMLKYANTYLSNELTEPSLRHRPYNLWWSLQNEPDGKIINEDWDTLCILDACRYDAFEQRNQIKGTLKQRTSLASNTTTFLKRNFLGEELHDTVYLTANPKGLKLENGQYGSEQIFHATISLLDHWDEETYTIHPDEVVSATLEARKQFPHKRLIVHFVQPHLPYIGEKAEELRACAQQQIGGWNLNRDFLDYDTKDFDILSFEVMENPDNDINASDLWDAYIETLDITLESVSSLVADFKERMVITADHGEMFGKRAYPLGPKIYTHPRKVKTDELRTVPWLVVESSSRPQIYSDSPIKKDSISDEIIEDRLRKLGYTS